MMFVSTYCINDFNYLNVQNMSDNYETCHVFTLGYLYGVRNILVNSETLAQMLL
jgi:hypothetical protein